MLGIVMGARNTRAIHDAADGAVGAFPHLVQLILLHALGIGSDGGTLHRHTILPGSLSRVDSHLVARLVTMRKAEVIIFSP